MQSNSLYVRADSLAIKENKAIHIVCVPLILMTAFLLVSKLRESNYYA